MGLFYIYDRKQHPRETYNYIHYSTNLLKTKLLRLGHLVSICRETFMFASKQCPQVSKRFEICRKTFVVQEKIAKTMKVLALKHFVLYGN